MSRRENFTWNFIFFLQNGETNGKICLVVQKKAEEHFFIVDKGENGEEVDIEPVTHCKDGDDCY